MGGFLDGLAAYLASFSDTERAVARLAFNAILAGRPVGRDAVAPALGLSAEDAATAIERHLARGTMVIEAERIVGARGLSISAVAACMRSARSTPLGSRSRWASTLAWRRAA